MNRHLFSAVALAALLVMTLPAQEEKEEKLKRKDVPPAVVSAASKAYPNAKIREWARESEDGKTLYEASMIEGGKKRDVLFAGDGTVVVVEEMIAIGDAPAAVKDAIKAKYPKGVIRTTEKITRGSEIQYEIGLRNAAKKEVVVAPDGRIVKEE